MWSAWARWCRVAFEAMLARGQGKDFDERGVERARADALDAGEGRLDVLVRRFGLDTDERDLLVIVAVLSSDPVLSARCRQLTGDRTGIDMALVTGVAKLSPDAAAALAVRLGPAHPLIANAILTTEPAMPGALSIRAPRRTIAYLSGEDPLDDDLVSCGGRLTSSYVAFTEDHEPARRRLETALDEYDAVVVLIEGSTGSGKRTVLASTAAKLGREVVYADLRRIDRSTTAAEAAFRGLARERALSEHLVAIFGLDDLEANDPRARALARFLDDVSAPTVVTSRTPGLPIAGHARVVRIAWPIPRPAARRDAWVSALGQPCALDTDELDELAYRYPLPHGAITRACRTAYVLAAGEQLEQPRFKNIVEAIHTDTAEALTGLAVKVSTTHAWDDLVVAPDTLGQIKGFQSRVKHALEVYERWGFRRKVGSATGASALFSGPPGTGKTMVAGLIARELGLQLYQVDLSKIVSKWVGETEKQLASLFDAAAAGHVMLLFDEADALFAKRSTDVRSATDRYANLEVNYLLQRIESFGGVSILTTNLEANLDEALRRRLSAHVVFYAPDEDERAELWRRLLVQGAPQRADIDVEALARDFGDLSGGHIKNAVVAAAFMAADERRAISQADLVAAARAEYVTLGRVLAR